MQHHVIVDERSWESINLLLFSVSKPLPPGKGMATTHASQIPAYNKHYESARISPMDTAKSSLGLDLRFEQTYLKSIAPHVHLTTPASDGREKRGDLVRPEAQRLEIKWGMVIWVTTRDQVLAPMFQGMIW